MEACNFSGKCNVQPSLRREKNVSFSSEFCDSMLKFSINQEIKYSKRLVATKSLRVSGTFHQNRVLATLVSVGDDRSQESLHSENKAVNKLREFTQELKSEGDSKSRTRMVLKYGKELPILSKLDLTKGNRVMGCTSQVWLTVEVGKDGLMYFGAQSDSEITQGLCALVVKSLNGCSPSEVLGVQTSELNLLQQALGSFLQQPSRTNGIYSLLQAIQKRTRALILPEQNVEPFPSLVISAEKDIEAQGEFAVAQAKYLKPDESKVSELASLLKEKKIGVVAHFYMDPEVQGVLVGVQKLWPHIHISDSLVMADKAVAMVEAGCESVAVLGVDFMAENVQAILARGGFPDVPVFRMSSDSIGCSLAEAAESSNYVSYLTEAAKTAKSLHVIYINTSLDTKAEAHSLVPTITCTSSNVVQTVLQAFAQVPDLTLWYGPDTYMGGNLVEWMRQLAGMSDEEIHKVHSEHNKSSISSILERLRYFNDGTCIVHDLFGEEVSRRVRERYSDAYLTAHFEVPGEMFSLAMEARKIGKGTVGSTQNILDFISARTKESLERGFDDRLQFVLGTESGMVTAIVQEVQKLLILAKNEGNKANVEVEIVFPVDNSAIATTENQGNVSTAVFDSLPIVPGVKAGEGCSISGGCASCPYMKMNSLDALLKVCQLIKTPGETLLSGHYPRKFEKSVAGRTVADIGCDPILHMRHFQKSGLLPSDLIKDILTRNK